MSEQQPNLVVLCVDNGGRHHKIKDPRFLPLKEYQTTTLLIGEHGPDASKSLSMSSIKLAELME